MLDLKVKRQQYALKKVKSVGNNKEYKTSVESLGMLIYKNNVIGALAYMSHKNEILYNHICGWLKEYTLFKYDNNENLLEVLVNLDSMTLMAITEEVFLLSDALKEFVKAENKKL